MKIGHNFKINYNCMEKWKSERIRRGLENWVDTKPKHKNEDNIWFMVGSFQFYCFRSRSINPVTKLAFTQIAKHNTLQMIVEHRWRFENIFLVFSQPRDSIGSAPQRVTLWMVLYVLRGVILRNILKIYGLYVRCCWKRNAFKSKILWLQIYNE